jgi:hypothetical protein
MKYRKKPIIIEAIQWTGSNYAEVVDFMHIGYNFVEDKVLIPTLEGTMTASPGDYIIKGVNKEVYPCKPDIFEKSYEPIEEEE